MIKFDYSFSNTDVDTLLCTLAIMPTIDFGDVSDVQQSINDSCCASAIDKFLQRRLDFHANEIRVMALSIYLADSVLKGEISTDLKTKEELSKYIFSINKLVPVFSVIFD